MLMMAFRGVRISWLMVARKRDLAALASSARWRASSRARSARSRSPIWRLSSARTCSRAALAWARRADISLKATIVCASSSVPVTGIWTPGPWSATWREASRKRRSCWVRWLPSKREKSPTRAISSTAMPLALTRASSTMALKSAVDRPSSTRPKATPAALMGAKVSKTPSPMREGSVSGEKVRARAAGLPPSAKIPPSASRTRA